MLLTLAPVITFWMTALSFHLLGLNSEANMTHPRNKITVWDSCVRMLQIDALHVLTTLPMEWGWTIPAEQVYGDGVRWWYLVGGLFLVDTVEYFSHMVQHKIPWLYRHLHYGHHEMRYSWSLGGFYNSLEEAMITGSLLGVCFMYVFAFTYLEFQVVSCVAVLWTVMDHTSAFDHVTWLGRQEFHRIHHSVYIDCNFQQPFFTFWDRWLGTDYESVQRRRADKHVSDVTDQPDASQKPITP